MKDEALLLQARQLAVHGGPSGITDEGLLESALARPENLFACGDPDLAALAAAYAYGIARNDPFIDGNEHASFATCAAFLRLNGFDLLADDDPTIATWLALADGRSASRRLRRGSGSGCSRSPDRGVVPAGAGGASDL